MAKKVIKTLAIILLIFMLLTPCVCLADSIVNPSQMKPSQEDPSKIKTLGNQIVYVVRVVGAIVSIAVLVILGIKFMLGSTEEKAEYKAMMLPYLIGAMLLFGGTQILGIIYNIAQSM